MKREKQTVDSLLEPTAKMVLSSDPIEETVEDPGALKLLRH